LREKQKLKLFIFKVFWRTIGGTESHKDLSEGVREDMGDIRKYWSFTEWSRTSWRTRRRTGHGLEV
jgi:hypothetical protein